MFIFSLALLLAGCSDATKDTDSESQDNETDSADRFAEYVYVTEAPVGDLTCFEGGFAAQGEWVVQSPVADKQQEVPFTGQVIDFETDDPVTEATVEIFTSNEVYGAPDSTVESDSSGSVSGTVPTCSPYSYRVSTDPLLEETKVTIEANQIDGFDTSASPEFNSVSRATYAVIPSLLGVSPDTDKGIVAGTAYDCTGDQVAGAQMVIRDDAGNIPESLVMKYFVDDFPNRNQEWTSEDGLWVAINVPVGEWNVEMYVADGSGGHLLMATSSVNVQADSINISSVYTSSGDGLWFPSSCLE